MYDIVSGIIAHSWVTNASEQQYVYFTCAALIIVLTAVFIDMVVRILFRFAGTR